MKHNLKSAAALAFLLVLFLNLQAQTIRTETLFDSDWKFYRGDVSGAEKSAFNDKSWRAIDLPHDWSAEDLPNQEPGKTVGPFSKESPGTTSTGYTVGGTGWYRKTFVIPAESKGTTALLNFDGVYMDCEIWINGKNAGSHPYGYTAFNLDITKLLNAPGKPNTIAVRVKNEGKNSRWYSGSGIYRHVWLILTQPVHISPWGVYITTPNVSSEKATVKISTNIENSGTTASDVKLITRILDQKGKIVATNESQSRSLTTRSIDINQSINISQPLLWSTESPSLYTAEVELISAGKTLDKVQTPFGIRTLSFDAKTGFLLNGKPLELKGGCLHHDNGFLGSATIDRAEERRVELMKAYGFNAIRTSHNPPSKQFLDACDRLGILVIDEAFDMWERPKNAMDYHRFFKEWWQRDIQSMVMRDRNHPSVIMWSIGNEINERADTSGLIITKQLSDEVRRLDPTRPITAAICSFWDHKGRPWSATAPAFALLDIGGYNYQFTEYEADHARFPERIMAGTESVPKDAFDNWQQVEKNSWVIGDFVWTAMDYMGETGIGHSRLSDDPDSSFAKPWPWFNAYCGDIDLIGFKKPQMYYRDVIWRNSKLEMAIHAPIPAGKFEKISYWGWPDGWKNWNWAGNEGKPMEVRVFTRCPAVRLELNGKIIGEKAVSDSTKLIATFQVPYQPGVLKAIGLENGIEVTSQTITTTGKPARIKLTPDRSVIRASRNDLSYVKVEITDEFGNTIPDAAKQIKFTISGEGELAGTGSACPSCMASFKKPEVTTFRGVALAILRPVAGNKPGTIVLKAEAEGLAAAEVLIQTK
jgi:beta-galactosidase